MNRFKMLNYDIIKHLLETGNTKSQIARDWGISRPTIDNIIKYGESHNEEAGDSKARLVLRMREENS